MKHSISIVSAFLLLNSINCFSQENNSKSSAKSPNVILILADDLGYETLKINGGESYKTPNIDKMADGGFRFEHCYAQPQCTPSRIQLLTGIYNVRNYVNFGSLDTTQVTVAQLFRKAGYVTGAVGKWQLGNKPNNANKLGFDEYFLWQLTGKRVDSIGWDSVSFPSQNHQQGGRDTRYSQPVLDNNGKLSTYNPEDYGPNLINDYSLDFIERHSKGKKPFFLYYSMLLVHCPFSPTPDSPNGIAHNTAVMTYKGNTSYFSDMVSYMDKMVGNINDKLEELGIAQNTMVIFVGDNGTDTPIVSKYKGIDVAGGKLLSTDAGTRVPMVAKWPGTIKSGSTSNIIDFTDFMPTMLESCGIHVPDSLDIDGRSFLQQMKGNEGLSRKWIYSWYLNPAKKEPKIFARTQRYKLYETGEFFDISTDYLEEHPIPFDSLINETKSVYNELNYVIDSYAKRRLDAIKK